MALVMRRDEPALFVSTPWTVFLTHHSHCDLGYTHDLPIVRELQRRFIDEALDLVERHADAGDAATFRWTCEVTAVVEHWLRTASTRQLERLLAAIRRDQIEVCALWCNLTPLAAHRELVAMLEPMMRLRRELGIPVRTAMNSDVNGFSWAHADLLRSAGITGLTMSINEHFGCAPQPFPGLFRWRTPTGGSLPVWNGPTYAHTAWLGVGTDPSHAFPRMREFLRRQRMRGWPHSWLHMQITHPGPQNDNMGPLAHLSPWVSAFNARYGDEIQFVITTPSRFFDSVATAIPAAPLCSGEWNDWWSFGVGSTPFETALFRRASAHLAEADLLGLISRPRNHSELRSAAQDALAHYIEHTWGADASVHRHEDEDTRVQQRHKEHFAYSGFSFARMLRRDGLGVLAEQIDAPAGPGVIVFNPSPYARCETVRIPRRLLEGTNLPPTADEPNVAPRRWPRDGSYQHFIDRSVFAGTLAEEIGPVELPPFGWSVVTTADRAVRAAGLEFAERVISNGRISLRWSADDFGLASIRCNQREWCAESVVGFGALLCEEVIGGDRGAIMRFDDSAGAVETRRPYWSSTPPVQRSKAQLDGCRVERDLRSLRLIQEGSLPNTDGVAITWILSADHDDLEAVVTIQKRPEAKPHAIYLALPFELSGATPWVETAGLVVNADEEVLPTACPWWSVQGGFALEGKDGVVAVATPDAPMVAFRRLPLGASQVEGAALHGEGAAFLWLYNNYWETNFKADAAGLWQFRVRIVLSSPASACSLLLRTGAFARHPLAAHPLPETGGSAPTWPPTGRLLGVTSRESRIESCRPESGSDTWRLVLVNPSSEPDEFMWKNGPVCVVKAWQTNFDGETLAALEVADGHWAVSLPPRSSAHVRIRLGARSDGTRHTVGTRQ